MESKQKKLSAKERNFCAAYLYFGNAYDAASEAGFHTPEKSGTALLARDDICSEIERLFEKHLSLTDKSAVSGYERLAFGSVEGAVKLLFATDPLAELQNGCSLFNVAEIKRPKEGALEIKFFDRIKALEKLETHSSGSKKGTSDFYNALVGGIADRDISDNEGQEDV